MLVVISKNRRRYFSSEVVSDSSLIFGFKYFFGFEITFEFIYIIDPAMFSDKPTLNMIVFKSEYIIDLN